MISDFCCSTKCWNPVQFQAHPTSYTSATHDSRPFFRPTGPHRDWRYLGFSLTSSTSRRRRCKKTLPLHKHNTNPPKRPEEMVHFCRTFMGDINFRTHPNTWKTKRLEPSKPFQTSCEQAGFGSLFGRPWWVRYEIEEETQVAVRSECRHNRLVIL